MDGDEDVSMLLVGEVSSFLQRDKEVLVTSHVDTGIRHVGIYESVEFFSHLEVDSLLVGVSSECPGILATVAGVNDHDKLLPLSGYRKK